MFVRNAFFSLSPRVARNNLARMILQRPYYLSSKRYYAVHVENRLPDKMLSVTWEDGKVSHFPHIYLRDNCPCKSCFDKGAGQRLTYNPVYNGFTKAAIKTARINRDNNVSIEWLNDDQHTSSIFQLDWLKANRFHTKYDDETKTIERRLWDSKIKDELPEFDFNHVISDNLMLYKWLRCVMETGIARVVNIPDGDGQLYKIADQVSHLRRSCYGTTFKVQNKGDHVTTIAYKSGGIAMHTDLSYYTNVPGILMLHCVSEASQGGESQFSDGFKAAEQLRANHPDYFELLSKYPIYYEDIGRDTSEFSHLALHPVIRTTENGEIKQICYGDHVRSTKIKVPEAKLSSFYDALIQFLEYAYSPANMIQYKMKSGTMTSIDNYRVFHGRTAFQPNPNNFRYVEGGYIDWDEAASRMRTLEDQLKIDYSTPII